MDGVSGKTKWDSGRVYSFGGINLRWVWRFDFFYRRIHGRHVGKHIKRAVAERVSTIYNFHIKSKRERKVFSFFLFCNALGSIFIMSYYLNWGIV